MLATLSCDVNGCLAKDLLSRSLFFRFHNNNNNSNKNNNNKDKYINKELTIISNTSHHVLVPVL